MNFTVSVSISIFSVVGFFVNIFLFDRLSNTSKRFSICAVESFLYALRDGNWKMGDGIQVGKGVKTEEEDHSSIIEHLFVSHPPIFQPLLSS